VQEEREDEKVGKSERYREICREGKRVKMKYRIKERKTETETHQLPRVSD
jgi:hypothetical protein